MTTGGAGHLLIRGDARRLPLVDRSVDLCLGSPPYCEARLYLENGTDLGIARDTAEWVEWMLAVTAECLRVSRGAVVWVAWGPTRGRNYRPACEGLMWEWWKRGGHAYRPCYWHRYGIPGSGGDQWFRADVEYAMCFKRPGKLPWAENTAMGEPPKETAGGPFSYRNANGLRKGLAKAVSFGKRIRSITRRKIAQDTREVGEYYIPPDLANPGNLISTGAAGGGNLGHPLAHQNEAPFPEDLAEWFVRSLCPPGGITLDPFSGSGTTVAVAERCGRNGVGLDIRQSQCLLGRRRIERPHAHIVPAAPAPAGGDEAPLFAGLDDGPGPED